MIKSSGSKLFLAGVPILPDGFLDIPTLAFPQMNCETTGLVDLVDWNPGARASSPTFQLEFVWHCKPPHF